MTSAVPGPKVNYQGNSKLDREIAAETTEKPVVRLKKIEGLEVVQTKKSLGKRIKESFGGQDLKTVGLHLLFEVVVPNSKDLLFDLIQEGGRRAVYGDNYRKSSSSSSGIVGSSRIRSTNYNAIPTTRIVGSPSSSRQEIENPLSSRERSQFDFSNLVLPTRDRAEEIIERMSDGIEEFQVVTVADFYDLIGITGTGFTDQKFGWDARAFATSGIQKVREGWIVNLPTPLEIA